MYIDNELIFSNATALTVTANSSVIDVTGAGSGNAPAMTGGINAGTAGNIIGQDIGAGDGVAIPSLNVNVSTTFTAGGAATLTIALQAAPGQANNTPGTYTTLFTSNAIPVANLVAGAMFNFPIPPILLAEVEALPRFYRVVYTVATGPFTAGVLSAAIALGQPNTGTYGNEGGQVPNNFIAL